MKALSAIQLKPNDDLIIDEIDIADPEGKQVQIKLISSGICHSQLHQMHDNSLPRPFLLGHEATGIVTKVGPECNYVKEGDHVIATWVPEDPRLYLSFHQNFCNTLRNAPNILFVGV